MQFLKQSTSVYCEISINSFELESHFKNRVDLENSEYYYLLFQKSIMSTLWIVTTYSFWNLWKILLSFFDSEIGSKSWQVLLNSALLIFLEWCRKDSVKPLSPDCCYFRESVAVQVVLPVFILYLYC